jgi:hypothetical protein
MKNDFNITWGADDGYVGGSRPHNVKVSESDLDDSMTEEELRSMFWDIVQSDFEEKVTPFSDDEKKFINWAEEVIEKQKQDEEEA